MRLIWRLEYRTKPGMASRVRLWDDQKQQLEAQLEERFRAFVSDDWAKRPSETRGSMLEAFEQLDTIRALRAEIAVIQERIDAGRVHPLATVGAPRVGVDAEATDYLRQRYAKRIERKIDTGGDTLARFLERYHGCYVPELAERGREVARIAGFEDGVVFFYGQVVADADFLSEWVRREAGEPKSAAALLLFGERIFEEIERLGRDPFDPRIVDRDTHIEAVRAAAIWCTFWGREGHGMAPVMRGLQGSSSGPSNTGLH